MDLFTTADKKALRDAITALRQIDGAESTVQALRITYRRIKRALIPPTNRAELTGDVHDYAGLKRLLRCGADPNQNVVWQRSPLDAMVMGYPDMLLNRWLHGEEGEFPRLLTLLHLYGAVIAPRTHIDRHHPINQFIAKLNSSLDSDE